jgi:membrane associated rhomboid family serine protease
MARPQRWQSSFTFGNRIPWGLGLVLALTIGGSLFVAFGSRHSAPLFDFVPLVPEDVWRGQVWRLVTWTFVEPSPIALIFSCLFIYWFGRDLADLWGSPRFLKVFGAIILAASVLTCLVALVDRAAMPLTHLGSWALTAAMTVGWGLTFPDRVVRIYFILPIRGYWLAWLTCAITVIYAVYSGWEHFLPELFAEAGILAWIYRSSLSARYTKVRRDAARQQQRSKGRAASVTYLRAVEADDDDPPELPPDVAKKVDDLFAGKKRGDKSDLN